MRGEESYVHDVLFDKMWIENGNAVPFCFVVHKLVDLFSGTSVKIRLTVIGPKRGSAMRKLCVLVDHKADNLVQRLNVTTIMSANTAGREAIDKLSDPTSFEGFNDGLLLNSVIEHRHIFPKPVANLKTSETLILLVSQTRWRKQQGRSMLQVEVRP